MITQLGTVFIRVSDLDKATVFYGNTLGFELQNIEEVEVQRLANYKFPNSTTLLTLIETKHNFLPIKDPIINLYCENLLELYDSLTEEHYQVGEISRWSSEWNEHIDFDVFDPDGQPINLICWTPIIK